MSERLEKPNITERLSFAIYQIVCFGMSALPAYFGSNLSRWFWLSENGRQIQKLNWDGLARLLEDCRDRHRLTTQRGDFPASRMDGLVHHRPGSLDS